MQKIKVFHIVEALGGGVFSSISQLCKYLDKDRFDICLVHSIRPETPENYKEFFPQGVNLIHMPMAREISPAADLKTFADIVKILKQHKPDIVHLHSSKAGFIGRLACRLAGIKNVFYSPRGFSFLMRDSSSAKRKIYYALEKLAARLGGTIVAVSSDELKYAKELSGSAAIVPNGVDLEVIQGCRNAANGRPSGNGRITAGTSGRISVQKDPALFLRSVKKVKGKAGFVWIGDGELRAELEAGGIDIAITGWKSRAESLGLLSGLDIYIQTSSWEGMPIAVLEAMALGKPVVATDIIGNRDLVVHGETGFLAKDENDLSRYLDVLIADKELRVKMGEKARALISERHDMKKTARAYEDLYLAGMGRSR